MTVSPHGVIILMYRNIRFAITLKNTSSQVLESQFSRKSSAALSLDRTNERQSRRPEYDVYAPYTLGRKERRDWLTEPPCE